jgi:CheY-like chemotaxis protein
MSTKGIMLVDDEESILDCLKEQLKRRFGHQYFYEVATNADEALEILEELNGENLEILIVVSDCIMPGMKGDELIIKVHERYPSIVTVMLTGQADAMSIDRARLEGNLHRCIAKPWTEEVLVEAIESGLS